MHTKIVESPSFTLKLLLKKPDRDALSFEDCIELRANTKAMPTLPLFKIVDKNMYSRHKLHNYNNVVKVMIFNFKKKVPDRTLAKHLVKALPTLFDHRTISKRNWEFCVYKFRDHILQSSIAILGKTEVSQLGLEAKLCVGGYVEQSDSEESSILEISEIFSDEMINL